MQEKEVELTELRDKCTKLEREVFDLKSCLREKTIEIETSDGNRLVVDARVSISEGTRTTNKYVCKECITTRNELKERIMINYEDRMRLHENREVNDALTKKLINQNKLISEMEETLNELVNRVVEKEHMEMPNINRTPILLNPVNTELLHNPNKNKDPMKNNSTKPKEDNNSY
jgi:chromosome segregation ATPase